MYQHGTIFSLNNRMFIYMVWTRETYTNSIIKVHYIWYTMCTNWYKLVQTGIPVPLTCD